MRTRCSVATRLIAVGVAAAATLTASLAPGAASAAPISQLRAGTTATPGSPDSGDSLFPSEGNGGYEVDHYSIQLGWTAPNSIDAFVTITATATQDLSAFNLDFDPDGNLTVKSVKVEGVDTAVPAARSGHEMTVTPVTPISAGATFVTVIHYKGSPSFTIDPDGSRDGWVRTSDGATVMSEPIGAMTWFPCNNTPRDKASYNFVITAPKGLTVVSNGRLNGRSTADGATTWRWQERRQMATYLASISIGHYNKIRGHTKAGVPVRSYIDPLIGGARIARKVPHVIDRWSKLFGPYPFETTGITIDNVPVGYALEVQSRPIFPYAPGMGTLVHELAHQWFGDDVTPADWSDIWLNEGFASYAEWLWSEQNGHPQAAERAFHHLYTQNPAGSDFWKVPVGAPQTPDQLFRYESVYLRGAMAVEAIRMKMGDPAFFRLLKHWPARHAGGNVSTPQLEAMAERISGKSLHRVFNEWIYTAGKPKGY